MLHYPRFYRLDSDGKGKYLIKRGDENFHKGNVSKAKEYYEEARKYSDEEARKRLERFSQAASTGDNQPSALRLDEGKTNSKPIKLTGPYFPILTPSDSSIASIPSSQYPSLDNCGFSFQDAPSTLVVANMYRNASSEGKKSIYKQINKIIQQFDGSFCSSESIQELAVLADIPDQQIFIAIINQLLKIEMSSPTLPEITIHGLAIILTSAPIEIDLKERQGLLSNILERLQGRLTNIRIENNSEELLPLLRALSSLFNAMLCRNMCHLAREDVYNPIKKRLSDIISDDTVDIEVSFLAQYTIQSLAYIGNDESLSMCIFRRGRLAFGIISDIKSLVFEVNLEKFETIYEKIISMSDISIKLEWYQGLLFIDCLLAKDDLSSFEKFIIESKLNSDQFFMQGVCLRLEQLSSSHANRQVSQASISLLKDVESNSSGLVQKTATASLNRLKIIDHSGSSSSIRTSSMSSTRTAIETPQYTHNSKLAPVWDKYWYSDPNSHLLKAVQDIEKQNLNMRNADQGLTAIQRLAPTLNNMDEVNKALMEYYDSQLTIRRVSGDELGLESCYINLAIVEASRQRENDKENLKSHNKSFVRAQSYEQVSATNTEKPIPLHEILNERKLINGSKGVPKRILIIGRAGIGKTTFCKKLVHTFKSGQWSNQFGAILWIPLRQLKQYKARNLEDLLIEKYFIRQVKNERDGLAHEFVNGARNGRVLFVLDGLDEFVAEAGVDDPLRDFLIALLEQTHVIITTRPYGSDKSLLKNLDLELETVGFSKEDIEQYVKSVINNVDESKSVMEFIQKTPLIQGLVNIPVQLDLICY
ncbi:hypothetical protein BGZ76_002361 [Entomortierella beljakovae]|nr:hypothetical protein BGZ76_002361 [Entomortierella beljakovae]